MVTAADGLRLVGTFSPGAGAGPRPAVLLLHMLGSNREAWAPLAPELADVGYSVLALDMRGHGETGGAPDWTLAGDDLTRVWQVLSGRPDVDAGRTAIIGASIGANLALVVAAEIPAVRTVVLLSPGLDYRGVQTEAAMTAYGDRPVLIVASAEDGYAADSSRRLAGLAPGAALTIYEGAGHGTTMLIREPGLTDLILDWLRRHSR